MLPENQWLVVRKDTYSILSPADGDRIWKLVGVVAFDKVFVDYVNSLLEQSEGSCDRPAQR